MTTFVALLFSDGTVGRFQFSDGVMDAQIDAAFAKNVEAWSKLRDKHGNPAHEAKSLPIVGWRRCTAAAFPATATFRNAWRDDGRAITIDMPAARDIHMNRIRRARHKMWREADEAFMRAIEDGDDEARATAAGFKRYLRDIPQTFDITRATTPDALAALWPEGVDRPKRPF